MRWLIGALVVVPLLIGGAAGVIAGVVEADGASLAIGALAIALGWPLMQFLRKYE